MKEKGSENFLAKVVGQNKEGKDRVDLFTLKFVGNVLSYEKTDIETLDWDNAKREYSVIGLIR